MPSASAKLEKQASQEAMEPLKQVLTMIEHKKRNLEKRKGKLEGYKSEQKNGKELNSEQQSAVAKYDEVIQTLAFANDLVKQIQQLEVECAKVQKKQQKKEQAKEAADKYQRDLQRAHDTVLLQEVLRAVQEEGVRLEGGQEVLLELARAFFPSLGAPAEEGAAAQLLVNLLDRKKKEWRHGTTYSDLYDLAKAVSTSDLFNNLRNKHTQPPLPPPQQILEEVEVLEVEVEDTLVDPAIIKKELSGSPGTMKVMEAAPLPPEAVAAPFFVAVAPVAVAPPPPVHVGARLGEVVGGGAFDFLQESQLEAPEPPHPLLPPPHFAPPPGMVAPAASAVPQPDFLPQPAPIPSQTFTNQSFQVLPPGAVAAVVQQQQPAPFVGGPPAPFVEEGRPEEVAKQVAAPASFAQAAFGLKTNGPPGFAAATPPQSQFQPIPTLEQEHEQNKEATWADGNQDDQQMRNNFRPRGPGGRGGRGGRPPSDRSSFNNRPRQNGQGRPGGYRQDGERSYENGTTEQKSYNNGHFGGRGRGNGRGTTEPKEWKESREWRPDHNKEYREPRDNSGGRRGGGRPSGGQFRGGPSRGRGGGGRPQAAKQQE